MSTANARSGGTKVCRRCGKSATEVRLQQCARCRLVCYCSPDCQKADWPTHKTYCRVPSSEEVAECEKICEVSKKAVQISAFQRCAFCRKGHGEAILNVIYSRIIGEGVTAAVLCTACLETEAGQSFFPRGCSICGQPSLPEHLLPIEFVRLRVSVIHLCCSEACSKAVKTYYLGIPDPRFSKRLFVRK